MSAMEAVRELGSSLRQWIHPSGGPARIVRRIGMTCPHGHGVVELDLLMSRMGKPEAVLRCTAQPRRPPACDQACRRSAEAVLTPVRAIIVYPGGGPFEDAD